MAFPPGIDSNNYNTVSRYQGVVVAELACMFIFYLLLKIIHFCKWGYLYFKGEESEGKLDS